MKLVAIQSLAQFMEHLRRIAGEPLLPQPETTEPHLTLPISKDYLQRVTSWLHQNETHQASFSTLFAVDERETAKGFSLYLVFSIQNPSLLLSLKVELDGENPRYPALTPFIPAAEWFEREIHDMFGIIPEGITPDPLVLHRDWPRPGYYPMRKDFPSHQTFPIAEVPHQFHFHKGEGIHEVAVGPIHAGIIEPGHLRFSVTGEKIHAFNAQLFYTHKGIEKMAEGKSLQEGLVLAERICGMCAFSHSVAYCQAVESILQLDVPNRAHYIRTLCLELERLANHFWDLTAICNAGGLAFASMPVARFRETMLQWSHHLTGHRFLRNFNTLGGVQQDLSQQRLPQLLEDANRLKLDFEEWQALVLNSGSLRDRLETTGYLTQDQAISLGLVGPAARGCDINRDMRRAHPYAAYGDLSFKVPTYAEGDVLARMKVRIQEVFQSLQMVQDIILNLPQGALRVELGEPAGGFRLGAVESAKGALFHWLLVTPEGKISRWHIRSASYMNWRGVAQATMGNNIVPDGPLINKSFNLCYACVDR